MKSFLVVLILILGCFSSSFAQQSAGETPAPKADVEAYLEAVHSPEMVRKMTQSMAKPMLQMIHAQVQKNQSKLPADFEARLDKIMDEMIMTMPFDEMLQAVVPIYQKHFSKENIDALVAFYSGPTGQKILREMPAITSESMQAMMPIMQKQNQAIMRRIQQEFNSSLRGIEKDSEPHTAIPN